MNMKNNAIMQTVLLVLRKRMWIVLLLFLAIAASMALQLTPAFILRKIIDENFSRGMMQGVWQLAFAYLLVTSGANIAEFFKVAFTTMLGQDILKSIRSKMAKRLAQLPMEYFVKTPTGDTMSRLTTDVDAINSLFSAGIISIITDLFKIGGLLVSLYVMAPQLLWLEVVLVPAVFLLSNYFRKHIFTFQKAVRLRVADIYTFIQEWVSGIRTVKAYSVEEKGRAKFQSLLARLITEINGISSYDSWFPCVMQTLRAVVIGTALWLCADNGTVFSLALSVGTLAAVTDLIGKLFAPIEALATEFQTIQQSIAGIERVNAFFCEPVEQHQYQVQQPTQEGISLFGISFSYGEFDVLKHVNLQIAKGEKAVLAGRSGAGKTTLMNLVSGL